VDLVFVRAAFVDAVIGPAKLLQWSVLRIEEVPGLVREPFEVELVLEPVAHLVLHVVAFDGEAEQVLALVVRDVARQ
jgi:hypothetical protein